VGRPGPEKARTGCHGEGNTPHLHIPGAPVQAGKGTGSCLGATALTGMPRTRTSASRSPAWARSSHPGRAGFWS